jgi:hypothetical protein
MRRFGIVATTALLAGVGMLGLTGCGPDQDAAPGAAQGAVEVVAAMGAEGQALAALGFDSTDIEPTTGGESSAGPDQDSTSDGWRKRHRARVLLRDNALHGEVVVQAKDGTKTIVVQRGRVTAIDADSMTVTSTDGFTLTWTFGDKLRVVQRRASVQPDQVEVGAEVGVAGAKDGDHGIARLIVIPRAK